MPDIPVVVDHLFRQEAGKMVSYLTRFFGFSRLNLAEDVVQDTLIKALEVWPFQGVPDNPSAWLMRTARNRAIDLNRYRRQNYFENIVVHHKELLLHLFLQDFSGGIPVPCSRGNLELLLNINVREAPVAPLERKG